MRLRLLDTELRENKRADVPEHLKGFRAMRMAARDLDHPAVAMAESRVSQPRTVNTE